MANFLWFTPLNTIDSFAADLASVGPLNWYKREHALGHVAPMAVIHNGERVGTLLFRIEETQAGSLELVIVAASVHGRVPLFSFGWPLIEQIARGNDCKTIRVHTSRAGLIRLLANRGACVSYQSTEATVILEVPRG